MSTYEYMAKTEACHLFLERQVYDLWKKGLSRDEIVAELVPPRTLDALGHNPSMTGFVGRLLSLWEGIA